MVPGPCQELVDGLVDPDRWLLDRSSGKGVEWQPRMTIGVLEMDLAAG